MLSIHKNYLDNGTICTQSLFKTVVSKTIKNWKSIYSTRSYFPEVAQIINIGLIYSIMN